ncbi:MAG: hypothetical protein ACXITV_00280 [Luteibaculaceae bacterium]
MLSKSAKIFLVSLFLVLGVTAENKVNAQCNDQLLATGAELLEKYTYLKDFRVRLKKSKKNEIAEQRFSVILSKGTKYRVVAAQAKEFPGNLIVSIFNSNGLVASNYDPSSKRFFSGIDFTCNQSGLYYVVLSFEDGNEGCGVAVLGFENASNYTDGYFNLD